MRNRIIVALFIIGIFAILVAVLLLVLKPKENENMEQTTSQNISVNTDRLLYLGHASLRITTREGKVIYIDPYAGKDYSAAADLILITHEHFDHNAAEKVVNRNEDAKIITWKEALENSKHNSFDFGFAKVEAVEAGYNSYHNVTKCVGYIITLSSGISIYVAGDTYITPEMPSFAERNLDYAFIPTDGIYTMTVEEASNIANQINAKHSVPYHMNPNAGFDEEIAEKFSAKNKLVIRNGEEIFVTTKMWTADYANGDEAIDKSLERLGLDYVDLMILHHPASNDIEAYKAMERAVKAGKIRSIGLSNYYTIEDFERLISQAEVIPALVQNENHPYHQNSDLKKVLEKYGTVVESWYPLGGRGHTQELFNDETISSIAKAHNKTSAQVLLRWHLQAGYIAIPGSSNPDHIAENYNIFDFKLSDSEMTEIKQLNRGERFSDY